MENNKTIKKGDVNSSHVSLIFWNFFSHNFEFPLVFKLLLLTQVVYSKEVASQVILPVPLKIFRLNDDSSFCLFQFLV